MSVPSLLLFFWRTMSRGPFALRRLVSLSVPSVSSVHVPPKFETEATSGPQNCQENVRASVSFPPETERRPGEPTRRTSAQQGERALDLR